MTTVAAHDLTQTRDCIIPGCENVDAGKGGPFTGRCAEHVEVVRENLRAGQLARSAHGASDAGGGQPRAARTQPAAGSLEQRARALVALGRKADRAHARASKAVAEAKAVKDSFDDAKAEFQQLARELAGGQ